MAARGGSRPPPRGRAAPQRAAPAPVDGARARAHIRAVPKLRAAAAALLFTACQHDLHRLDDVRAPAPAPPDVVRVLLFGDFGYDTIPQGLSARALRRVTRAEPFDLAVQLGDNLYYCGPDPTRRGAETCRFSEDRATVAPGALPPDDPIFLVNERPLRGLRGRDGKPLPILLVLGNHDIGQGRSCTPPDQDHDAWMTRRACLNVARSTPEWKIPARRWVLDVGPARLVAVDTNVAVLEYGGFTYADELAFLREALAPCGPERQCFVLGHHPPAAALTWRPSRPRHGRLSALAEAADGKARAMFAGHIHTLEHLSLGGLEVFISGSTAMGAFGTFRTVFPASAIPRFATTAWGFAILEVHAGGYRVAFHDVFGEPLHCCEAGPTGRCEAVWCRG